MMSSVESWLRQLHEERGSDLFVTADAPPCVKVNGKIRGITTEVLLPEEVHEIIHDVMNETATRGVRDHAGVPVRHLPRR